jgi:hypothetical protein
MEGLGNQSNMISPWAVGNIEPGNTYPEPVGYQPMESPYFVPDNLGGRVEEPQQPNAVAVVELPVNRGSKSFFTFVPLRIQLQSFL